MDRADRLSNLSAAAAEIGWTGRDLDILSFANFGEDSFYNVDGEDLTRLEITVLRARSDFVRAGLAMPIDKVRRGRLLPNESLLPYLRMPCSLALS